LTGDSSDSDPLSDVEDQTQEAKNQEATCAGSQAGEEIEAAKREVGQR
jgi:hypothetical protein